MTTWTSIKKGRLALSWQPELVAADSATAESKVIIVKEDERAVASNLVAFADQVTKKIHLPATG